jgi:hypothetical protein
MQCRPVVRVVNPVLSLQLFRGFGASRATGIQKAAGGEEEAQVERVILHLIRECKNNADVIKLDESPTLSVWARRVHARES